MRVPSVIMICLAVFAAGCGAAGPRVSALGVSQGTHGAAEIEPGTLLVFLEVVNPTERPLTLSRLEYHFDADAWFEAHGEVRLSRAVDAGDSVVIEVPVRIREPVTAQAGAYVLDGRLFGTDERVERQWNVRVRGTVDPPTLARVSTARLRVGARNDR